MFTGLVEGQGRVSAIVPEGDAVRLDISVPDEIRNGLGIGDSVCINGCCLTVIELAGETAAFQAGTETLSKTNLGRLANGHPVNLERSLPVDGRLGGHFVQGHVDGTGEVVSVDREADRFSVALIPHTLEVTTLGIRTEGEIVNIETDILGKYVDKLMASRG
jgi:riboflavin synthase